MIFCTYSKDILNNRIIWCYFILYFILWFHEDLKQLKPKYLYNALFFDNLVCQQTYGPVCIGFKGPS